MTKLRTAYRLAAGDFVPFLVPVWSSDDWAVYRSWRQGERFPGAPDDLRRSVERLLGEQVAAFPVGSGRVALALALLDRLGDRRMEVIVPSFSCAALPAAIRRAGHEPVLVDIDEDFNISAESVEAAWGDRVGAVVVPHLGGVRAAGGDSIAVFARKRGAMVVEDAAHRIAPSDPVGTADAAIFSTGIGKPLFGPGGGLLVLPRGLTLSVPLVGAPSPEVARLRYRGFVWRYLDRLGRRSTRLLDPAHFWYRRRVAASREHGGELRLEAIDGLEASLALLQLERLPALLEGRRANAQRWRTVLAGLPLRLAPAEQNTFTKLWVVSEQPGAAAVLRSALWDVGVECEALYTPLHLRQSFRGCRTTPLPITDRSWREVVSLPARPNLDDRAWERIEEGVARARSHLDPTG